MRSEKKRGRLGNAVFALIVLSIVAVWPALATTTPGANIAIHVINTNDSGPGSLRDAITHASPGDTIDFNLAVYPATITLTSVLSINTSLTIDGPGASHLAISGNGSVQVVQIASGTTVAISGVTITGGSTPNGDGAGIHNSGTLTLTDSTVFYNWIDFNGHGAGIFSSGSLTLTNSTVSGNGVDMGGYGGGIYSSGRLTLTNSTVSDNAMVDVGFGGGIYNAEGGTVTVTNSSISDNRNYFGDGGGIHNSGTLTLINSTVSNNLGSDDYGGILNGGTMTITKSTVSGNVANQLVGGIGNFGMMTITNSTVSGNVGGYMGYYGYGGGIVTSGTLTITNSTISGNSVLSYYGGDGGAGIVGTPILKNTILANNTSKFFPLKGNCSSPVRSYGHNLSDDSSCSLSGPGDLNNTPAGLDPNGLKDNGGPTQTIALLPTSPAIDAIPLNSCTGIDGTPIGGDQRGLPRPQGLACDIGAFEYLAITAPAPDSGSTCNGAYNGTFNGNLTISPGQNCVFFNGRVTGNVQQYGGSFVLFQSQAGGNVQVKGGGTFSIGPRSTINGNLRVQNLPTGSLQDQVCGTHVIGDLQIQNNGTAVLIGGLPPSPCTGNAVGGNLQVQNNWASTTVAGNTVGGSLMDQNNTAATQVFNNTVSGSLHCQNDTAIQGGRKYCHPAEAGAVLGILRRQLNANVVEIFPPGTEARR